MFEVDWTDTAEKNGLDPLGMQATCVRLYQSLVPGISNVTIRLRYYAFYALVTREYGMRVGVKRLQEWRQFLRRSEALLALVAYREGQVNGVAGTVWASDMLREHPDDVPILFYKSADRLPGERQYLKQSFGAYGAAYGSQLWAVGILTRSPEHELPVLTETIGERLADLFLGSTGDSAGRFFEIVEKGEVLPTELDGLFELLPNRIDPVSEECQLLRDLLMSNLNDVQGSSPRAKSIRCLLQFARTTQGANVNSTEFRWATFEAASKGVGLGGDLAEDPETLWKWGVYHASDLLHVAYETFLRASLELLKATTRGVPAHLLASNVAERIIDASGVGDISLNDFVSRIGMETSPSLRDLAESCAAVGGGDTKALDWDTAYEGLKIVAHLFARYSDDIGKIQNLFQYEGAAGQTLATELAWLMARKEKPLQDVLTQLIQEKVLDRHIWVAMRKLNFQRDYTFLFEVDEGLVRFRKMDGPVFTNPRLSTTITFLRDAKLLGSTGPSDAAEAYLEAV